MIDSTTLCQVRVSRPSMATVGPLAEFRSLGLIVGDHLPVLARDSHVEQDPHQHKGHVHEGERAGTEVQDVEAHGHDGCGSPAARPR